MSACALLLAGTLSAMDKESWVTARAQEIEQETKVSDNTYYQEKSAELHRNQIVFRGALTSFWGYVFHKETKKIGAAAIKGILFLLSLWWLVAEFRKPSKASARRTSLLYYRETRGINWARVVAEEEWEKRHTS